MPKGLSRKVRDNLEKCRSAAIAAVDVYNRPGPRFRTAHYIVLIVLAWTALFHSISYKKRKNPWYKKPGRTAKGDRYIRIDGDPKHWDLSECIKQHYGGSSPPERKNLEFLVGLRNKIEHRHLPELDPGLYGECQAALLNLEELLEAEFGSKYSLVEQLAVSLQFTGIIPAEKKQAAKKLASSTVKTVRDYVETFRGGLPATTLNSTKYSFNVFLVPKVAGRKNLADVAVEFVKVDEASKEELERLERLNVLIKEKHIPIANLDLFKPSQVVSKVHAGLPHRFTVGAHTAAWQHFGVRPSFGAAKPEVTMPQYCVYDAAHGDYLYTTAWIEKLIRELTPAVGFQLVIGRPPVPK